MMPDMNFGHVGPPSSALPKNPKNLESKRNLCNVYFGRSCIAETKLTTELKLFELKYTSVFNSVLDFSFSD